jgi:hypothetical protein
VRPRLDAGARQIGRSLAGFDLTWMLPALVSDDPGARDLHATVRRDLPDGGLVVL